MVAQGREFAGEVLGGPGVEGQTVTRGCLGEPLLDSAIGTSCLLRAIVPWPDPYKLVA